MGDSPWHIRSFRAADLPEIQRIRKAAFEPIFDSFRHIVGDSIGRVAFDRADEEQADYLDSLVLPDSGQEVYVVTEEERIIAFCALSLNLEKRTGEIGLNAVDPALSRKGVGTFLYAYALDLMKARGIQVVEVSTGGDPAHLPARRAYEKVGFGPTIPSVTFYKWL